MSLLNKHGFTAREMEYLQPRVVRDMNRRSQIHWNIRVWGAVIFLVLITALFIRWSEAHTKKAEAAYDNYNQCVMDTYGVTVDKFYQVYGKIPHCK